MRDCFAAFCITQSSSSVLSLNPGTAYRRLCQSNAGSTTQSERKDPTMAMFRKDTHPRSERRGAHWVQFRWNALSKRSLWQGFLGRFGDSSFRRSRSVPRQLVRASSGAGCTQRKQFAVRESRQALSAAGVPAGSGGLTRNTTQHGKTEYFRFIFTLLHLRDIFDWRAERLTGQGVWREAQRKNAGNGFPCQ